MEKKVWENRDMAPEEIIVAIEELENQILAFELRLKYEEKLTDFRELYLAWYDERLTLGEILQAMMDSSICQQISPFERD